MMKKLVSASLLMVLLLGGCGLAPDLPDDPLAFEAGSFTPADAPEDGYIALTYQGRTYIPYGTIHGTMHRKDVGACLGYYVQDGTAYEDVRICLIADDPAANWLVQIETGGEMAQPAFYRAVDTAGQDIPTPDYIEDLGYAFWG